MQFLNIRNKKIIIYGVFLAIFIIGTNIYKDYGMSFDDDDYRKIGQFHYEYIKIFLTNNENFSLNTIKNLKQEIFSGTDIGEITNHPVIFEILVEFFVDLLNLNTSKDIYELSHFINFTIFLISLIFFYKLIRSKFDSQGYGLFSVIFLFLTPRIFAESFYNSRDIFFLSLFIFNIYLARNFLLKQNFNSAIVYSLSSALLINAKILGLLPPILFLLFYFFDAMDERKTKKNEIKFTGLIVIFTIFFIYIFWPYLWLNPIQNFLSAFSDIVQSQNSISILNLYLGDYTTSNNMPWHYRIVWFAVSTPTFVLFFFIIGFCVLLFQIFNGLLQLNNNNKNIWSNKDQMYNFYLFFVIIITITASIKFNTSQFGGWRHFYFLYPIVILFSLLGFKSLLFYSKNINIKFLIYPLIGFNLLYVLFWNVLNHPHQQVFFNYISKNYAYKNFDLDYWGISNIHSLRYIIKNNNNYPLKIGTISFNSLKDNTLLLTEKEKKKINIVYKLNEANFLIENYKKKLRNNYKVDKTKYVKYYEILVNNVPINTVYKKID